MNQIINLLVFLKELVFGRVKSRQHSKATIIKMTLFMGVFALSLYGNYVLMKATYSASAKYIAAEKRLAHYNEIVTENHVLKSKVAFYEMVLGNMDKHNKPVPAVPVPYQPPTLPRQPLKGKPDITLSIDTDPSEL